MTFKTDDRVYETSITTGTGDYTLEGAPTGFIPFSGMGANNLCAYFAIDGINWEVGIGTILTGPARLQRTKILRSSNADAAVDWAAGTRELRCGGAAAMAVPRTLSKSVAGGVDVALTQDEQRRDQLVLTGVLTGNINVTVDATPWRWSVYNDTSGSYTLKLKTTGGAGIFIPPSVRMLLECDGVDVVEAASAPSSGRVVRTAGNITTTSTSLVDVTGASVTLTTRARPVFVNSTKSAYISGAGDMTFNIDIDGALQLGTSGLIAASDITSVRNGSFSFQSADMTSGAHTIKEQWKVSAGTGTILATSANAFIFGVSER